MHLIIHQLILRFLDSTLQPAALRLIEEDVNDAVSELLFPGKLCEDRASEGSPVLLVSEQNLGTRTV
jgi:hypothetical protein